YSRSCKIDRIIARDTVPDVVQPNPYRPGRTHTSRVPPVIPPIYQTSTFELDDQSYKDIQGTGGLHETWYSRFSNPTVDAAAAEAAAHAAGARLVVDNTFASPFCTRPLRLGADVVVESATKFLSGHSDVLAGAVTVDDTGLYEEIQRRVITFGGCLDPHAAFL